MTEAFLHFIWQRQYFDNSNLTTAAGKPLEILFQGFHNQNAGPDFFQSRIRIDDIEWVGAVEIHLRSSDFFAHGHHKDEAYGTVVLHVVWEQEGDVHLHDHWSPPVLVMKGRIEPELIARYENLVYRPSPVLCGDSLSGVNPASVHAMISQAAAMRLEQKIAEVRELIDRCGMNRQEAAYRLTARAFGLHVNAEPFMRLAELFPLKILLRIGEDLPCIEALLFGVAGFLDGAPEDDWHAGLQKEFNHMKKKFPALRTMKKCEWKFLRMRPHNFPTLRIAQFAALIRYAPELISDHLPESLSEIRQAVSRIRPSFYWERHYRFGVAASGQPVAVPGKNFYELYMINVRIPMTLAGAAYFNEPGLKEKAVGLLHEIAPEKNSVVRLFSEAGIKPASAFETQGLLHQYHRLCVNRKCMQCEVGLDILGRPRNLS